MADDLNVVYRVGADISGLKEGVAKAIQSTAGLEKSATDLGTAFEAGFGKITSATTRGIGTVTSELIIAQREVKALQKLVLENADKPGFIAGVGYELDAAIPKVNALERELAGLQKGLSVNTKEGSGFLDVLGKGNSLLATFGAGLSIAGAVSFGKAILDDADALVKMSDRTGMSIEGLQRLQVAGDDAGNTVEQMSSAVNMLQGRLAGGNDSAESALRKLHISLEDFKSLNPENQFIAISDAIRQVKDPMEQTRIAMDLFGQSGAELLPTLKRGFDDLKGAVVGMSEETVLAMDAAGDVMSQWWRLTKGYTAEATVAFVRFISDGLDPTTHAFQNVRRESEQLEQQLQRMIEKLPAAPMKQAAPLLVPTSQANADEIQTFISDVNKAVAKNKSEVEQARKEWERWHAEMAKGEHVVNPSFGQIGHVDTASIELLRAHLDVTAKLVSVQREAFEATHAWMDGLGSLGEKVLPVTNDELARFNLLTQFVGPTLADAKLGVLSVGQSLKKGLTDSLAGLNGIFQSAFEGGGGLVGAVKSYATQITANLLGMIPGIGPLLSQFAGTFIAGIQKIWSGIRSLFGGPSADELAGRQVVEAFQQGFKNVEDMINQVGAAYVANGKSAADAQAAIQRLWDAERQGADATKKALQAINDELKRHKEVADAIDSQGFKTQDQIRHEADIANQAYEDMLRSGQYTQAQVEEAYRHYQELLAQLEGAAGEAARAWLKAHEASDGSVKASADAMKAAESDLKALIDKRDDLSKGIAAEAPEAVMGVIETQQRAELKLLDVEIQRKADAYAQLARDTGQAMADAIVEALKKIHVTIDVGYNLPQVPGGQGAPPDSYNPGGVGGEAPNGAATGGIVRGWGIQHFMTGMGRGTDTVPAWLTPGEMVLTRSQQASLLGGNDAALIAELRAIRAAVLTDRETHVQIGEDSVAKAYHRSLDRNPSGIRTEARELLGVA